MNSIRMWRDKLERLQPHAVYFRGERVFVENYRLGPVKASLFGVRVPVVAARLLLAARQWLGR